MPIKNQQIDTITCDVFKDDLARLLKIGKVSNRYAKHLAVCSNCQSDMQAKALSNIKALNQRK